jgi:hypothetical protein
MYVCSGRGSINLRRRRISRNAFGDEPVAMSSRCSCAKTSASVKAPLSDTLTTFLNTEVSATVVASAGSSSSCVGAAVAVAPGVAAAVTPGVAAAVTPGVAAAVAPGVAAAVTPGVPGAVAPGIAGAESWVRSGAVTGTVSGAVSETTFCVSSDAAALAAARSLASLSSFASLRSSNTCACADAGNGSTNSRRRSTSNNSVGDAPVESSSSTSAKTSGHVNPPVSNARKTFTNTAAAGEILVPICVVRRHT